MTLTIAHRGGADLWPENTMAAFAGAIACGADGAELDVHLTRDGKVVVFHDEALKPEIVRGRDGQWLPATGPLLKDLTFAELQNYDVGRLKPGSGYARRHPAQSPSDGQRIPLLTDVIDLAKARSETFQLWIELKTDLLNGERGADPIALADAVLEIVQAQGFSARTIFISFDWRTLRRIKERDGSVRTLATTLPRSWFKPGDPPPEDGPPPPDELARWRDVWAKGAPWEAGAYSCRHATYADAIVELGADGWFPFYRDVNAESAAYARGKGLSLAAWTVPAGAQADLVSLGVDAVCTDDPTILSNRVA